MLMTTVMELMCLTTSLIFEQPFSQPIFSVEFGTSVWCLTFGLPATHGSQERLRRGRHRNCRGALCSICLDVLCVCEEFHPSNGWFGTICVVHFDFKRFTLFLIFCFCLHLFWGFAICLLVFLAEGEGEEEGYGNLISLPFCFVFPAWNPVFWEV